MFDVISMACNHRAYFVNLLSSPQPFSAAHFGLLMRPSVTGLVDAFLLLALFRWGSSL
jgi:hypothetical protein